MRVTWLLDGRLGASGMLFPRDAAPMRRDGVTAILSLTVRNPFAANGLEGISHLHLPVPDMSRPSPTVLHKAVSFLRHNLDRGGRVVVHCGAGLGRTGTILACYLCTCGQSFEEAIRAVRAARPGSVETEAQERAVRDFHDALEESEDG